MAEKTVNTIKSIDEYNEWLKNVKGAQLLYRGLADSSWNPEASCRRRLEKDSPSVVAVVFQNYVKQLIDNARIQGFDRKEGKELSDLELLAELQHYGAATCLIDFTQNPLVALWFACNDHHDKDGKVIVMATDSADKFSEVTYTTSKKEITTFLQPNKIWKWTPPNAQNNRIVAQNSVFLCGPDTIPSNLYEVVIINSSIKKEIIKYLESKHGITEQHMYSDFSGFALANAHGKEYTQYTSEDYFFIGLKYHQTRENEKAVEYYGKAIDLNPQYAVAYNNRGIAKAHLDRNEEAIKDYDKVIELNPKYVDVYNNRGLAKAELGRNEEAIKDYDKAIDINPQYALAYTNRGLAKAELGRNEEAMKDYDKAIELNPQYAEAYYNLGFAKAKLGRNEEAMKDYDKAIELNPQLAEAYNNRGKAKAKLGRNEEAIKDFDKAIELNPQLAEAYNNREKSKGKLGRN